MSTNEYVLGHSAMEIKRLQFQAKQLRPYTHRMLVNAGLTHGMRVLDIGCGTGAVSVLAAELTGSRGQVVAIDRNETAIKIAMESARADNVTNIDFRVGALEDFCDDEGFDMVIGRYVLVHQPDAVAFLKKSAQLVRSGGCVAFHEVNVIDFLPTFPTVELFDALLKEIYKRMQRNCPEAGVARRMVSTFVSADLAVPEMFCEVAYMGNTGKLASKWLTDTLRSMSDGAEHTRLEDGRKFNFQAVTTEIERAIEELHAQVHGPFQVCAWTSI